jgi:hypothetical protein
MTPLTQRERTKIPRQKMPEQDPIVRRGNFNEVALGFTEELMPWRRRTVACSVNGPTVWRGALWAS